MSAASLHFSLSSCELLKKRTGEFDTMTHYYKPYAVKDKARGVREFPREAALRLINWGKCFLELYSQTLPSI